MKILVTGTAGFIGFHLVRRLCARGDSVMGLDNINDYYDVSLKHDRLRDSGIAVEDLEYGKELASAHLNYRFVQCDLVDRERLDALFKKDGFDAVCHLAAQAGVRYSLDNPQAYIDSNITGFLNILECCRHYPVKHLVYASSSSIYGLNGKTPFSTLDNVDHPISLYAASKKSNELMAHTYSYLFGLPVTGLRFFTVYGPWGRPDMAYYKFAKAIQEGRPIDVYNFGDMKRDFTFIEDIIDGLLKVLDRPPAGAPSWDSTRPDPSRSLAPYRLYNIGNSAPVSLMDFIQGLEQALGRKAEKNMLPMQPGDVPLTYADVSGLEADTGYRPSTPLGEGIREFVAWFRSYHKIT